MDSNKKINSNLKEKCYCSDLALRREGKQLNVKGNATAGGCLQQSTSNLYLCTIYSTKIYPHIKKQITSCGQNNGRASSVLNWAGMDQ